MDPKAYELHLFSEGSSLAELLPFVKQRLEGAGCTPKIQRQVATPAEEIFVNIANYACGSEPGPVSVRMEHSTKPAAVTLTCCDAGFPFDPLSEPDPDVSLPGEDRALGALGIFLTKGIMDELSYQYTDGQNILTMKKAL